MAATADRITKKLVLAISLAVAMILIVAAGGIAFCLHSQSSDELRMEVLELNEMREHLDSFGIADDGTASTGDIDQLSAEADAALANAQHVLREAAQSRQASALSMIVLVALMSIGCLIAFAVYLHTAVIKPFKRLEGFAQKVAEGDLDTPLRYERTNPFGPFAWAFDHMRMELARAHEAEAAAAEAYKTALASLSHDLRTPMASVRAYAEALDMGLAHTEAERKEYERVIMRKCDEASDLVEDLFQHALADMERIAVACEPVEIAPLLMECARMHSGTASIACVQIDRASLFLDPQRFTQLIGNLLANAEKYASGSEVHIEGVAHEDAYCVTVRDFGPGVAPEELPFLTERFFRGANAVGVSGAGLGLFIVSYLTERMGGTLFIENAHPGFRASLAFPYES